jgi:hypothetical protein
MCDAIGRPVWCWKEMDELIAYAHPSIGHTTRRGRDKFLQTLGRKMHSQVLGPSDLSLVEGRKVMRMSLRHEFPPFKACYSQSSAFDIGKERVFPPVFPSSCH